MRTAREDAHAVVCDRQGSSEWCHWSANRENHAHYCDTLTAVFERRDAETRASLATALELLRRWESEHPITRALFADTRAFLAATSGTAGKP